MYILNEILELSPNNNIRVFWMRFKNTEASIYIRVNDKTKNFQVKTSLVQSNQGSCWIPLSREFKPYYREVYWDSFNCQERKQPVFGWSKKDQNELCEIVNNFIKTIN